MVRWQFLHNHTLIDAATSLVSPGQQASRRTRAMVLCRQKSSSIKLSLHFWRMRRQRSPPSGMHSRSPSPQRLSSPKQPAKECAAHRAISLLCVKLPAAIYRHSCIAFKIGREEVFKKHPSLQSGDKLWRQKQPLRRCWVRRDDELHCEQLSPAPPSGMKRSSIPLSIHESSPGRQGDRVESTGKRLSKGTFRRPNAGN